MKGAYAQYYNGMAVLNMLPVENEVYLYPDLVKGVDGGEDRPDCGDGREQLYRLPHAAAEERKSHGGFRSGRPSSSALPSGWIYRPAGWR